LIAAKHPIPCRGKTDFIAEPTAEIINGRVAAFVRDLGDVMICAADEHELGTQVLQIADMLHHKRTETLIQGFSPFLYVLAES